jgi:hypothetical protein
VDRLPARSVTGQSLDIRVHQHIGYRVHFEWDGNTAMERRFFSYSDAVTFCIELCKYGLEGLCSCIYGAYHSHIPGKAPYCHLGLFRPGHKYHIYPKWWIKYVEEQGDWDLCGCDISSTSSIGKSLNPATYCLCRGTRKEIIPPENIPPINEGPHLRL